MSNELKDCPFCGCRATFVKHSAGMPETQGFDKWDAVACKHCRATIGASDRRFRSRDDASEAWNLRVAAAGNSQSQDAAAFARKVLTQPVIHGIAFDEARKIGGQLVDVVPADDVTAFARGVIDAAIAAMGKQEGGEGA
jgi:Lar family restriction alleviation protein